MRLLSRLGALRQVPTKTAGSNCSPVPIVRHAPSFGYPPDVWFSAGPSPFMDTITSLLPRFRRSRQKRFSATRPQRVGQQVIQGQPVILEGVLDISKEARDAIAEGKAQNGWHPFEMGIRPDSPTGSSGSSSGSSKAQQLQQEQQEQQQQHSAGQVHRPLSSSPPFDPPEMTSPSLSAKTVMPRDPDGRRFAQSITIPARPDAAPPLPLARDSLIHSLRRQPRYTELNSLSPIRRCRTFPLSVEAEPAVLAPVGRDECSSSSRNSNSAIRGPEKPREASTTGPNESLLPSWAGFAFPMPPKATFTKRWTPTIPPSASLPVDGMGHVEPLSIVKRESGSTSSSRGTSDSSRSSAVVINELLSSLDDMYAEIRSAASEGRDSFVSIPLDSPLESLPDLDGAETWAATYSLADEPAAFVSRAAPPRSPSAKRHSWIALCPHSFVLERAKTVERYRRRGVASRSLPDLACLA
ncbi:unnamed protein product [Mycena citricolor]|uniref:Uncharacterized protein n=1 Tax=Mycena citricolor TaxID=2018698 RepID=A0AAD2H6D6_9AGAR|nr:unnamed protein product [Mycena citricolor]